MLNKSRAKYLKYLFFGINIAFVSLIYGCNDGASNTSSSNAKPITNITISPESTSLAREESRQYIAKITYADNTESEMTNGITWSSSNHEIATISNTGLVTAATVNGATEITARYNNINSNKSTLIIKGNQTALVVDPRNVS